MNRKLFGTDGIRGPAGQYPLDAAGALQIGKAIGMYFAQPGEMIMVGYDPRESPESLKASVIEGLSSVGVNTIVAGVVPTPGLAYLTKTTDSVAGIMITASHNPYTDNGIKVFSAVGGKLSDDIEEKLNELIDSNIPDRGEGQSAEDLSLVNDYHDFLVKSADGIKLDGLRIALDMANGATSTVAAPVFAELGADVVPLFDQPNGTNINTECGATDTRALIKTVVDQGLDGGCAFDGDGDRLMIIDAKGRELDGDHVLYILACSREYEGIVATQMSNMGLEKALQSRNISVARTAVGDRYVLEGLEQTGYKLGGEKSGHIIMPTYAATGDGILAAIQTLKSVRESGKSLADWFDELKLLPQELINIPVTDKSLLNNKEIQDYISEQASLLGTAGRINVRASGTEPKVRVMVESADAPQRAQQIAQRLTKLFEDKN